MRKHILFIVNTDEFGGAEKHLLALIHRLANDNIECTLMCFGPDFYSHRIRDCQNVRIVSLNGINGNTLLSYRNAFSQSKAHIVVFVKGWFNAFPTKAYVAARASGAERVFAIEHLMPDSPSEKSAATGISGYLRRYVGSRERYMWKKWLCGVLCHRTICVSNGIRERLVREYGYPEDKTVTVSNGVDLNYYVAADKWNPHQIGLVKNKDEADTTIVCIARLARRKRIDILLEAWRRVSRDHPRSECVIVGAGPLEEELRRQVQEFGLTASVHFLGFAEDVRPYIVAGDIFVSPSEKEGLPLTVMEAMACGLPCVVTNVSGNNEVVVDGVTGLLVSPGSASELADRIGSLIVDKEKRKRMGVEGRRRVEEYFNNEATMARIKDVLLGRP